MKPLLYIQAASKDMPTIDKIVRFRKVAEEAFVPTLVGFDTHSPIKITTNFSPTLGRWVLTASTVAGASADNSVQGVQ